MDFLVLHNLDGGPYEHERDPETPQILAGGGWLDAEESSSVFLFMEFETPELASQLIVESEREGWPLVQGYNSGENHPIQHTRQVGPAIIAVGVSPNIDLGGWLLGN